LGGYIAMGIDVKVESPHGSDEETLHDPQGLVGVVLATANLDGTKCLGFIDPYGDTVFNQSQIPVLISELKAAMAEISPKRLKSCREAVLDSARGAKWDNTVLKEYEKRASASEFELRSEIAKAKSHIEKVLEVLQQAINAGPHHFVRFIGD
jgi:hypothetical protein